MKKIEIAEQKRIQLRILEKVAEFCNNNNLRYFLCGGTLLGAIRHKGYIPWDDDIDIMMPRSDYEEFLSVFKIDGFELFHYKFQSNYNLPFVKISDKSTYQDEKNYRLSLDIGVNIDVFPVDGFPIEQEEANSHILKLKKFRTKLNYSLFTLDIMVSRNLIWYKKIFLKIWARFLKPKKLVSILDETAKKYDLELTQKGGIQIWGYGKREICPKEVFQEILEVEFEGKVFKVPKKYDVYLSNVYGDYMKLPPPEERIRKHNNKAWFLSK